jgi:hypothetical protein
LEENGNTKQNKYVANYIKNNDSKNSNQAGVGKWVKQIMIISYALSGSSHFDNTKIPAVKIFFGQDPL